MPVSHTTGEIADICQVTKRTVIKWIDSGKLTGYTLPDSKHRRVTTGELRRFMKNHNIPDYSGALPRSKILIVDDDPDFSELLKDALSDNFDLDFAGSALEAASKLPVFQPDIILLDIRLPDISGLEVCTHFQKYRKERNAAILAMSAYGKDIDLDDLMQRGADDFIPKPMKILDLKSRIRSLVS